VHVKPAGSFYSRRVENFFFHPTVGVLTNGLIVGGDTNNGIACNGRFPCFKRPRLKIIPKVPVKQKDYPKLQAWTHTAGRLEDFLNCKRGRLQQSKFIKPPKQLLLSKTNFNS